MDPSEEGMGPEEFGLTLQQVMLFLREAGLQTSARILTEEAVEKYGLPPSFLHMDESGITEGEGAMGSEDGNGDTRGSASLDDEEDDFTPSRGPRNAAEPLPKASSKSAAAKEYVTEALSAKEAFFGEVLGDDDDDVDPRSVEGYGLDSQGPIRPSRGSLRATASEAAAAGNSDQEPQSLTHFFDHPDFEDEAVPRGQGAYPHAHEFPLGDEDPEHDFSQASGGDGFDLEGSFAAPAALGGSGGGGGASGAALGGMPKSGSQPALVHLVSGASTQRGVRAASPWTSYPNRYRSWADEIDEYSGDEDDGYRRGFIPDQRAFILRDLNLQDEDLSEALHEIRMEGGDAAWDDLRGLGRAGLDSIDSLHNEGAGAGGAGAGPGAGSISQRSFGTSRSGPGYTVTEGGTATDDGDGTDSASLAESVPSIGGTPGPELEDELLARGFTGRLPSLAVPGMGGDLSDLSDDASLPLPLGSGSGGPPHRVASIGEEVGRGGDWAADEGESGSGTGQEGPEGVAAEASGMVVVEEEDADEEKAPPAPPPEAPEEDLVDLAAAAASAVRGATPPAAEPPAPPVPGPRPPPLERPGVDSPRSRRQTEDEGDFSFTPPIHTPPPDLAAGASAGPPGPEDASSLLGHAFSRTTSEKARSPAGAALLNHGELAMRLAEVEAARRTAGSQSPAHRSDIESYPLWGPTSPFIAQVQSSDERNTTESPRAVLEPGSATAKSAGVTHTSASPRPLNADEQLMDWARKAESKKQLLAAMAGGESHAGERVDEQPSTSGPSKAQSPRPPPAAASVPPPLTIPAFAAPTSAGPPPPPQSLALPSAIPAHMQLQQPPGGPSPTPRSPAAASAAAAAAAASSGSRRQSRDPHDSTIPCLEHDPRDFERHYEVITLRVVHRRGATGFEETKDFPIRPGDVVAGRYLILEPLGSAAFSSAVQARDLETGMDVCLKIIKNNKDYFDQSLDEIKLLRLVNRMDPADEHGILRLYDYFYYKEHLFIVTELLRANLYEFQKFKAERGEPPYFTMPRLQSITKQVLRSLAFLHSLGLIHSDLKPENILMKSYSKCLVKVIDLGSSCFLTDHLSSYVQSRSYRAPEVILGLPYDQRVDIWSLGCILAELASGYVLLQNDSLATLLARLEGIMGPVPAHMLNRGRFAHKFFTRSGRVFEKNAHTGRYEILKPKLSSLRHRVPQGDDGFISFVSHLLVIDPDRRPTAIEALSHPWLQEAYPDPATLEV